MKTIVLALYGVLAAFLAPAQTQDKALVPSLTVVRKLDALGAVLDEVVQQGANQIQGISFSVADSTPLLDEARRKAMADARRKSDLYAKEAGVQVGQVLLIQEQTPHIPGPVSFGFARADAAANVPIAEGELDFGATITVTYRIGANSTGK